MNRHVASFYAVVSVSALTDMALLIGLIWAALRGTSSPLLLGVLLGLSAFVPFTLRRVFPVLDSTRLSVRGVVLLRTAVYAVLALIAASGLLETLNGFILTALLVGILNYITTSAYEAANTKLVLAGLIDSGRSARWMQTAFQLGAFSGSFLGGLVLDKASLPTLVYGMGAVSLIVTAFASVAGFNAGQPSASANRQNGAASAEVPAGSGVVLCLALGMIGFHIGSFNTMVPLVYQGLNGWSSAEFGLASGVAGLGAFAAAILPLPRLNALLFAGLLVAADYVLAFSPLPLLSIGVCVLVGFSINTLRISIRQHLIELATTPDQANSLAATSSFYFIVLQSAAPLCVGFLVSDYAFGRTAAPYVFVGVGVLLMLTVVMTRLNPPRAVMVR